MCIHSCIHIVYIVYTQCIQYIVYIVLMCIHCIHCIALYTLHCIAFLSKRRGFVGITNFLLLWLTHIISLPLSIHRIFLSSEHLLSFHCLPPMSYGLRNFSTWPPLLLVLFSSDVSFSISNPQSVQSLVLFIFTVTGSFYFFICYCHCVWLSVTWRSFHFLFQLSRSFLFLSFVCCWLLDCSWESSWTLVEQKHHHHLL